mgnify:FL=1
MISNPTVSIITATLNSAKTVEETIQSVLLQTYPRIEYLIVDGGSTDGTLDILERYRPSLARVISEPDNGIYDAFNKGIAASSGEILYFLNSDDSLADSGVVEHFVRRFREWPEVWAIYGNVRVREGDRELILGRSLTVEDFRRGEYPQQPAMFVRRRVFEKLGPFDTRYRIAGDIDLIARLYLEPGERIRYDNRVVSNFRRGGISSRYDTRIEGMREAEGILRRHFGEAPDLAGTEIRNNALYRMWLENLLANGRGITGLLKPGCERVAIFGTRMTARYLLADLRREGLTPVCFLDNNPYVQGTEIEGVAVRSPDWLKERPDAADAVIVSVENERDAELAGGLRERLGAEIPVWTWKELVLKSFRQTD